MGDFTPINTQEEFDAAIKSRIEQAKRSEKEAQAKNYEGWTSPDDLAKIKAEYDEKIKGFETSQNDSAAKLAQYEKDIAERDTKIKGYESSNLKSKIAHEMGIPYELAGRLTGDDETAIRKDAESLSKIIKSNTHHAPAADKENKGDGDDDRTSLFKELAQNLKRKGD